MKPDAASASAPARPRHFPCFDGLRAMAAILVVMVHTSFASGFTLRSWGGIYTARLEIGVAVFFLISGFLLYRPFAASHIAGTPAPGAGKFWVRRLLRILPAYWLAFIIISYGMHADTVKHGWTSLFIYFGLVQIYFPSHVLTGITQAWSLCTEMSFYLFLPLYAAAVGRRRRSDRSQLARELVALGCLFVVGLTARFVLLHVHAALAYVALQWLPSCLDLFALGMGLAVVSSWLAHRQAEPRWLWHPALPWVSWALALAMLWCSAHLGVSLKPLEHNPPARGLALEVCYGMFAFFLLLPAVFGPQRRGTIRRALQAPPVVALGVISYGIYLWHQAWVAMFLRWGTPLFRVAFPEMFGVVLGLAVGSAALSYLIVERPILNVKDRLGWWARPQAPTGSHVEGPALSRRRAPA